MRQAKARGATNTMRGMIATSLMVAFAMLISQASFAHGGGHGHGGAITHRSVGFPFVVSRATASHRHVVSHREAAFRDRGRHSGRSSFLTLGADGAWVQTFIVSPNAPNDTNPAIREATRPAVPTGPRVIQPPQVAQGRSIQIVRGNSISYALF